MANKNKKPENHRSLANIIGRFAERTSITGPSYISTSSNIVSKSIWVVLFAGAIGMTIYMVSMNFTRFFSRPIKTTISLQYAQLTFPMVTLCNTNPIRDSSVGMAGQELQDFLSGVNPQAFARTVQATTPSPQSGAPSRRKRYVNNAQKQKSSNTTYAPPDYFNYEDDLSGETAPQFEVERDFAYMVNQLPYDTRYEIGHKLEDMLLSCSFEGRECSAADFTLFQTSNYGNCYKFNEGQNGTTHISRRTGQSYGLQLILYLEVDDYIPGLTLGYGMRLSLSAPRTYPPIQSEGILVSSGVETSIGMQLTNITRLGTPYGNCSTDTGNSFLTHSGLIYTRIACQDTCEPRQILEKCGCVQRGSEQLYPSSTVETVRPCDLSDVLCINTIKGESISDGESCVCPTACSESVYQTTVSSREWPEEAYMNSLVDAVCTIVDEEWKCDRLIKKSETNKRRNFAKVNVYYKDLNYEQISEEPDYPNSSFYSDLGGSIGLWVGFSVLGLLEAIQLLLELCRGCLRRCWKRGEISASRESMQNDSFNLYTSDSQLKS